MGKKSQIFLTDKNKSFSFLPDFDSIKTEFDYDDYDLIIVNDSSTIDRLDYFYKDNPKYFNNKDFLVLDHHIPSSK
jgi:nanoRNase/pAp phosphatase (c-di-AMP/oligoRNAs hydrolase)